VPGRHFKGVQDPTDGPPVVVRPAEELIGVDISLAEGARYRAIFQIRQSEDEATVGVSEGLRGSVQIVRESVISGVVISYGSVPIVSNEVPPSEDRIVEIDNGLLETPPLHPGKYHLEYRDT
jgi:hypothetical protein